MKHHIPFATALIGVGLLLSLNLQSSETKEDPKKKPKANQDTVYVTATGKKYHRVDCSALRLSRRAMLLEEAKKEYEPCKRCRP